MPPQQIACYGFLRAVLTTHLITVPLCDILGLSAISLFFAFTRREILFGCTPEKIAFITMAIDQQIE